MKPSNTNTQEVERDIEGQGMASEQAADLAALQAAAATDVDAGAAPQEAQPAGPDLAAEFAGLAKVAVAALSPMFPSLGRIYTEQTIGAATAAIAGVCNKHGWLQGGVMGEYAEEITCLAVVGPLALATYQGVKQDLADHAAKAKPVERLAPAVDLTAPPPPPAPAPSKEVTFGAPASVDFDERLATQV